MWLLAIIILSFNREAFALNLIHKDDVVDKVINSTCYGYDENANFGRCMTSSCGIRIVDEVFSNSDALKLLEIANKGFSTRPSVGGPSIVDINTGYLRDSQGLVNLFMSMERGESIYTEEDFTFYRDVINKLKNTLEDTFDIENLHFTAPTFITRLDGRNNWEPNEIHDEYWHPHVDRQNTAHYHYSGLLYLSNYGEDFSGGRLIFIDEEDENKIIVEPKIARMAIFTSGNEHPHYVERLESGQRFVLSFWFTCKTEKKFEIFLDGHAHIAFASRVGSQLLKRQSQGRSSKEL